VLSAVARIEAHHGSQVPEMAKQRNQKLQLPQGSTVRGPAQAIEQQSKMHLVNVLESAGSDMATTAVNQLLEVAASTVASWDMDDLSAVKKQLMSLLRKYDISWTKKHLAQKGKKSESAPSAPKPKAKREQAAPIIGISADDYSVKNTVVGEVPFISLEDESSLQQWLAKPESGISQAVVFLGEVQHERAVHFMGPLLWRARGQTITSKVWRKCSIIQLGGDGVEPVQLVTAPSTVATSPNEGQHYITIRIHGDHSTHFDQLLTRQMAKGKVTGRHNGSGSKVSGAGRQVEKTADELKMDQELRGAFEEILQKLIPTTVALTPVHRVLRYPTASGKGTLTGVVSLPIDAVEEILEPHSGVWGMTFRTNYPESDQRSDKNRFHVIWAAGSKRKLQMPEIFELCKGVPGFCGCILDRDRNIVGVRIRKSTVDKSEICRLLDSADLSNTSYKYRVSDIPLHWATKSQVQSILQGTDGSFQWPGVVVLWVGFDKSTSHHFSEVRAPADPPAWDLSVENEVVLHISKRDQQPAESKIKVTIGALEPPARPASSAAEPVAESDDLFGDVEPSVESVKPKVNSIFTTAASSVAQKKSSGWLAGLSALVPATVVSGSEQAEFSEEMEVSSVGPSPPLSTVSSSYASSLSSVQPRTSALGRLREENESKFQAINNRIDGVVQAVQENKTMCQETAKSVNRIEALLLTMAGQSSAPSAAVPSTEGQQSLQQVGFGKVTAPRSDQREKQY